MTASSMPRLAIVLSHPTQYYSPWFRWLQHTTPLSIRVFYLWNFGVTIQRDRQFQKAVQWDVDLLSGYEHEFVPNLAHDPGTHHFRGLDNPELIARLEAWRPDILLLFGYKWRTHLRVIWWARRKRIPLLFRGDSHFLGRGAPRLPVRSVLRILYSRFAASLYVGKANRDYFKTLGVADERLFFSPHAVDQTLFDPQLSRHHTAAAELRRELRLEPRTRVVLFAGKFVPDKQPRGLLAAFLRLNKRDATLIFVGSGPDGEILRAEAAGNDNVHFLPFANQSEMPARYLLADIFVLPSIGHYETWGLAVNEAMHMGVPALVSDLVGCQQDLVTHGKTGWVFRHNVANDLQTQLEVALSSLESTAAKERMRENVKQRVADYSYAHAAAGLLAAVEAQTRL